MFPYLKYCGNLHIVVVFFKLSNFMLQVSYILFLNVCQFTTYIVQIICINLAWILNSLHFSLFSSIYKLQTFCVKTRFLLLPFISVYTAFSRDFYIASDIFSSPVACNYILFSTLDLQTCWKFSYSSVMSTLFKHLTN